MIKKQLMKYLKDIPDDTEIVLTDYDFNDRNLFIEKIKYIPKQVRSNYVINSSLNIYFKDCTDMMEEG